MKTSVRFDNAINKLYLAFHNKTLNPDDFKQCAVGNILDNKDSWKHLTDIHGSTKLNYLGLVHQNLGRRFNGYLAIELLQIENAFLMGCGYNLSEQKRLYRPRYINETILFNGLCNVVTELCRLDKINDVMDCSVLFNYNSDKLNTELV